MSILLAFYLGGCVCEAHGQYASMIGWEQLPIFGWPIGVAISVYDAIRRGVSR